MSATDELRKMLDERGVKWEDASPVPSMKPWKTSFTSFTGEEVTISAYDEPKWLMGTMVFLTPEQAIAATLGAGTCHNASLRLDESRFHCSECGFGCWVKSVSDGRDHLPRFCPNCGRRIEEVDE